jgi:sugar-specific transcriptional regulator TrmB
MSFSRLRGIGFTDSDTAVYELLIRGGEFKKEELAKKTGLSKSKLDEALMKMATLGAIEVRDDVITAASPKNFLQKYLRTKEVELELQLADLRGTVGEMQSYLEPIYSESRYGLRLEELWGIIDGLPAMEMETIRMISRAKSEVCILAEMFRWYNKVREELISALDRKVAIKVLLLQTNQDTRERIEDMKRYGISVRLASCDWRSLRFTLVDNNELAFLVWAKKSDSSRVYYRPGFTKNPGLISVFSDSFEYLWEKAQPL